MTEFDGDWDLVSMGGVQLVQVHSETRCVGRPCCIHNPSDHPMVTWPQRWRGDKQIVERLCTHGVGHPDPDDLRVRLGLDVVAFTHRCDGCCRSADTFTVL